MTSRSKFRLAWKTVMDKWKITVFLTVIFVGFAALYTGIYPAFEDMLEGFADFPFEFIRGFEYIDTFPGYLNMELYQIFWILVLPILIAYVTASLVSEEIEGNTIDMLMSNPISRKKVVLEKFLGIIPLILIVTFATMGSVYGVTYLIGEEISLIHLFLTHLWSIPYFLAVASISLLISTVFNEKMKASIIGMAIVIGMYLLESIAQLVPEYEKVGVVSLVRYYDPTSLLIEGKMEIVDPVLLVIVTVTALSVAVIYFERRDIP